MLPTSPAFSFGWFFWHILILYAGRYTQIFILNHLQIMKSYFIISRPYVHDLVLWNITFLVCSYVLLSSSAVLVIRPVLYHTAVFSTLFSAKVIKDKIKQDWFQDPIFYTLVFPSRQKNSFPACLGTHSSANLIFICRFGTELVVICHVAPGQNP